MNDRRSYVASNFRTSALKHAEKHGGELFTTKDIESCAMRKVDLKTAKGKRLWVFYCDKLIPNVVGRDGMKEVHRHYKPISKCPSFSDGEHCALFFVLMPPKCVPKMGLDLSDFFQFWLGGHGVMTSGLKPEECRQVF